MEKVISINEFKLISKQFRRLAGDLLGATDSNEAMRLARRFVAYINEEQIIADFIAKNNIVQYDMEQIIKDRPYDKFSLPFEVEEEIAFIYQLLSYLTDNFERYDSITRGYALYKGAKISDSIRNFNKEVVKLLINAITDYLETKAIVLGIDEKPNAKFLIQGNVGQLNFTETGNITATQNNNGSEQSAMQLLKEILPLLNQLENINDEIKVDAIDFVEETVAKIESGEVVKPSLIRRTTDSLKKVRTLVDDGAFISTKLIQAVEVVSSLGG